MKSICRYYRCCFVIFFKDVIKLDDWAGKLDDIKKAEAAIQGDSGTLIDQDMLAYLRQISQEVSQREENKAN